MTNQNIHLKPADNLSNGWGPPLLRGEFPKEWDVDCEYNRHGENTKTIPVPTYNNIKADDLEAKTVFPDIIVHKRGNPGQPNNLLVIEVKKSNNRERINDTKKLKEFTREHGGYEYILGLLFVIPVGNQRDLQLTIFENGQEK